VPAADPAADPDADVVVAAWVDTPDFSPCRCRGVSGLIDAGALIDADDPVGFAVPAVDPVAPPPGAVDGSGDIATLNGSGATLLPLLALLPALPLTVPLPTLLLRALPVLLLPAAPLPVLPRLVLPLLVLNGPEAALLPLLVVAWPFGCMPVWACAAVRPRRTTVRLNNRRIVLS